LGEKRCLLSKTRKEIEKKKEEERKEEREEILA
jgi:hypothetical protein